MEIIWFNSFRIVILISRFVLVSPRYTFFLSNLCFTNMVNLCFILDICPDSKYRGLHTDCLLQFLVHASHFLLSVIEMNWDNICHLYFLKVLMFSFGLMNITMKDCFPYLTIRYYDTPMIYWPRRWWTTKSVNVSWLFER